MPISDTRAGLASAANLPDALQFMQLLWAVVHGLERTSKRMGREIGVTGPQRLVVRVVGLVAGISAGELAAILHVHPSTLTGVLERLVQQRLIVRVDHPRDRRRAVLRLTALGRRANKVTHGTVESAIAEALAGVSGRDRATARRVLARLADHLEPSATAKREPQALRNRPRVGRRSAGRLHARHG